MNARYDDYFNRIGNLEEAAGEFVKLGDDPGIFMTCETGGERGPIIVLKCQSIEHLHAVHQSLIDIVSATREVNTTIEDIKREASVERIEKALKGSTE